MSPQRESFNWGNVALARAGARLHIQLSKSHVPRWFTEGLTEYETTSRGRSGRASTIPSCTR